MRIFGDRKMGCEVRHIAVGAIILAAGFGGWGDRVRAQEVVPMPLPAAALPGAPCPMPGMLPMVPAIAPRLMEGAAADQKWSTGPGAGPTASFVDALKGNDAVIEVIVGQGRLLTLKADVAHEDEKGVIAVGDPDVLGFEVLPNPRLIRLLGTKTGVTDLSITTADQQTVCFEVHVVYDLALLQAQLKQGFPDAQLRLFQIREHLAVEGQARSIRQVDQILQTIEAYSAAAKPEEPGGAAPSGGTAVNVNSNNSTGAPAGPKIINLLRVPGVQQVMLQVRIAELNRTALREIGADMAGGNIAGGDFLGTLLAGGVPGVLADTVPKGIAGVNKTTSVVGVFNTANFEFVLRALRTNAVLSILAEPNLVALSGQKADFLAGGEFPVPVPQNSGGGTTITIEFKKFGVQLEFLPFVLEDETIRLTVSPEESSPDYTKVVEINGYFIPGINTRRASTTVEMRQGQTLAMAGLLRQSIDANTKRIPGLGDLPYIGPFFSNTTHTRMEKELVVLVTPYLVAPMNPEDVPCLPGEEIKDPNDLEFYLLNRIEGRTGRDIPATRNWDDPWHLRRLIHLEQRCISGPVGLSPIE